MVANTKLVPALGAATGRTDLVSDAIVERSLSLRRRNDPRFTCPFLKSRMSNQWAVRAWNNALITLGHDYFGILFTPKTSAQLLSRP